MDEENSDASQAKSVEEFCDKLMIRNILEILENQSLSVQEILKLKEIDVNEMIPANFMKERLILREFLSSYQKGKSQSRVREVFHGVSIDLMSLLKNDWRTTHLLGGSNDPLDSEDAALVARLIVNFWKTEDIKPTRSDLLHAFRKVEQLFKAETIKNWIGGELKGRGIIHERLYNQNKLAKKRELNKSKEKAGEPKRKRGKKQSKAGGSQQAEAGQESAPSEPTRSTSMTLSDDQDVANEVEEVLNVEKCLSTLKTSTGPLNKMLKFWHFTFETRKEMKYNLNDFMVLQSCEGPSFIAQDFDEIYKTGNSLQLKFSDFKEKIKPILTKNIRDANCKKLLQQLNTKNITQNAENYLILTLLHGYIKPKIMEVERITKKHTILDSQKFFLTLVPDVASVMTTVNEYKNKKKENKSSLQPMMFAVGKSELDLSDVFIVYVNDRTYDFKSLLDAVTFCFKLHFHFDWKYQEECFQVWCFIERFFFEMDSQWEDKLIDNLIRKL